MTPKPVISIEQIGKLYRIGSRFGSCIQLPWNRKYATRQSNTELWAIKNISFTVEEGDVVGIIGKNGAGKSTLLKVLSRITPPTEGRAFIRGRLASLLEVGTGFHPELTGRENIYMNGAILGMTRRQIARRFDEIVSFAEISRFLDTPVKRYSSGMYVRLAFAVAAHLDSEILIVDEVLSVGDASFQTKCLGKMDEASKSGRTVLFVSHNMAAVSRLCNKGVVLSNGLIDYIGSSQEAIRHYSSYERGSIPSNVIFKNDNTKRANSKARFVGACLEGKNGSGGDVFFIGDEMYVRMDIIFNEPTDNIRLSFAVRNADGVGVYHCVMEDSDFRPGVLCGRVSIKARFPHLSLYPGTYYIDDLWLASGSKTLDNIEGDILSFTIAEGGSVIRRRLASNKALVHEVPEWTVDSKIPNDRLLIEGEKLCSS